MKLLGRVQCRARWWGGCFVSGNRAFSWCVVALLAFSSLAGAQNNTPQVLSVSPASASGLTQTFTFSFADPDGATDLGVLNILINDFLDGDNACYLAYARSINVLYLVNDAGNALLPGLVLNGGGSVGNSQCSVSGGGSSVSVNGNTLQLTLAMTFSQSFQGRRIVYMAARDAVEANSGWQALGVHAIPGGGGLPKVTSVAPGSGSGAEQIFTLEYEDASSAANLGPTQLLVNSALDGRQACYTAYSPSNNAIFLVDDVGNAGGPFAGGFVLGTPGASASNTRCTVFSDGSSVSTVGTTLTVRLNLRFTAAFNGPRILYAAAQTATGGNTGWQALGAWLVGGGGSPALLSVNPAGGQTGQSLSVAIAGENTSFQQGVTQVSFGAGVTVGSVTVNSPTSLTAAVTVQAGASPGQRAVAVTTGAEVVNKVAAFTVSSLSPPVISDFSPKTGSSGTAVSLTGSNLAATSIFPQVFLAKQGGGTISAPVVSATANSLGFVIPPGATTGKVTVTVAGQSTTSSQDLAVVASSSFMLSANPGAVDLIKGQTAAYSIDLTSANGFTQLASLTVTGMPAGVTYSFKPEQISSGQTAILEVKAPANQPSGISALTITASSVVDGINLTSSAQVTLNVAPITTSFVGRTVVDDTLQTSLAGVTVTMLGKNGNGQNTSCSGQAVSDSAGNFALTGLPASCVGPQLVGFDGLTAISPPGEYAGVNLIYTLTLNQVTASPVLVHLPRIDNAETFFVTQNSTVEQHHDFTAIPGLSVTVYPNTTLTLPDGTQPNPFPLTGIQVPIDRLPDYKPPVPTMVSVFIVAFQPANSVASKPVAVYYPNTLNTPPGTDMPLMTLDPTRGQMVPYGTGTVSNDGLQIVPDFDPSFPGARYGIVNFDWHGQMPPPPPDNNPPPDPCAPSEGKPVDLASGLEVMTSTDLVLNGNRGNIAITRTYRTLSNLAGPFGIGTSHDYDYRLDTNAPQNAQLINLVLPTSTRIPFTRQQNGVLINATTPMARGATLTTENDGRATLRWATGEYYKFVPGNVLTGAVLVEKGDPNGNITTIVRPQGTPAQIVDIIDPVGRRLSLTYDNASRVTSVKDPIGRTVTYTYNNTGRLATFTNTLGGMTRYEYDAQGRLFRVTDPRGVVLAENLYDADGRVSQQTLPSGGTYQYEYTLANPLVPTSPVVRTDVTDPHGNTTIYRFNPEGFLISATDPLGQIRAFEREPGTNLLLAVRGNGMCQVCGAAAAGDASFTYGPSGKPEAVTNALGNTVRFTYEPVFGHVASREDPLGNRTQYSYDDKGNAISIVDARGSSVEFVYDSFGQVEEVRNQVNAITRFTYDSLGDKVKIQDSLGRETLLVYDAVSRLVEQRTADGLTIRLEYNAFDQLTSIKDGTGNVTEIEYDSAGYLTSYSGSGNSAITFDYDSAGRVSTRTDQLGVSSTFQYDLQGNLVSTLNRRGQLAYFEYDPLNRLVKEEYADAVVQRTYDSAGRLVQVDDSMSGVFRMTYDLAGQLRESVGPAGAVAYTRDANGLVVSRQSAGQDQVTYVYDATGNVKNANMGPVSILREFDPRGLVKNTIRSNGVSGTYTHDTLGQLTSMLETSELGTVLSRAFEYNTLGRIATMRAGNGSSNFAAASRATFNSANQVLTYNETTYSHDADGNRTGESSPNESIAYRWDARGRLVELRGLDATIAFTYDYSGNLIEKRTTIASGETRERYLLDDLTNVISVQYVGAGTAAFLTGRNIDQHWARSFEGNSHFAILDQQGSTVAVTDHLGAVVGRAFYGPSGLGTATGVEFEFGYTGRVPITERLYYYRARFLDVQTQRFLSEDPLGLRSGDANLYRYVSGDPVNLRDPTGEIVPFLVSGGVGAALGVAGNVVGQVVSNAISDRPLFDISGRQVVVAAGVGFAAGAAAPLVGAQVLRQVGLAVVANIGQQAINNAFDGVPLYCNFGQAALTGAIGGATGALPLGRLGDIATVNAVRTLLGATVSNISVE